jgi:hypothetical protein
MGRPRFRNILWERGLAHEQSYIEHLEGAGFEVVRIDLGGERHGNIVGRARSR